MIDRGTDRTYLAYQYGDSEKLKIRLAAHERYGEQAQDDWHARYVDLLGPAPGESVLDVGCGFGAFQPALCAAGARVIGFDLSTGMAREARQRAVQAGLSVQAVRADAQRIPLADRSVDHALVSHMLYHVPDIRRALEEMRRVVKVGGRVLITTNAADHSARLNELHARAARELDYTPVENSVTGRFSLDHLPLVRSVFPNASVERQPNAFLFPTVESALRYYASGRIDAVQERGEDDSHRRPLLRRMSELLEEILAREGVIRIPKDSGCFLATVEA